MITSQYKYSFLHQFVSRLFQTSIGVFLILALSILVAPGVLTGQSESDRPNIIFILADDLGYGDISAFNEHGKLHTENVDRLAREGMKFTDAHTTSSVCTPTRYSILTGRYNWRSRLKKSVLSGYSKALIDGNRLTVAEICQEKGYHTGYVGKWHLGWDWQFTTDQDDSIDKLSDRPQVDFSQPIKNGPKDHGFTYSYGFSGSLDMPPYVYVENGYVTAIPKDSTVCTDEKGFWRNGLTSPDFNHTLVLPHLTEKAVSYIDARAADEHPFLLYFPLPAPHTPILPITEFMGKSNTNFYGDFVLQVDDVVGQIMAALEKHAMHENTLIIFTSDNGCSPRADFAELAQVGHDPSHIFRGHKADIFEGGHRVPFVVRWPSKIKAGSVSDEVISTVDFMRTIAEVVGYELSDDAAEDSYSLLPILLQQSFEGPLREATVHHSINGSFAIRQGTWKLILCADSGGWSAPRPGDVAPDSPSIQLYDLAEDPQELDNLQESHPEKVAALKELLTKYIKNGRSTAGTTMHNDGPEVWPELHWME
ncbi:MAG: arylsulfatase [Saprospiraceae bacterium]|nr:arylsulfatase [Saprospiraceae bacterium]